MNTEVEVKFLNQDFDTIRNRLSKLGAVRETPMRLMRRAIIDYPDRRLQTGQSNAYIRVRDEGDKITLTYKQFDSLSIAGAQEVKVVVDSFENTIKVFTAIGLEVVSFQESKRETWKLNGCEIVLDEWPWLNPYLELEGESAEKLQELAEALGLSWSDAVFGDVMVAYRAQYPYLADTQTVGAIREILFDAPFPSELEEAK